MNIVRPLAGISVKIYIRGGMESMLDVLDGQNSNRYTWEKKINTMRKLDLHGIRHGMVRHKVIRFIEDSWDIKEEIEIMTGHSKKMQEIVEEVLKEYKLDYKVGDFLRFNKTFIKIIMD